jgi:hypothetical protein
MLAPSGSKELIVNCLRGGRRRDTQLVAKDLAQAGVDAERFSSVSLAREGSHQDLVAALSERDQTNELATGAHRCR